MTPQACRTFIAFATAQYFRFDPSAWTSIDGMTREQISYSAALLSMVAWYGHGEALRGIAQWHESLDLHPGRHGYPLSHVLEGIKESLRDRGITSFREPPVHRPREHSL
jgi:hypothetical protein